MFFAGRWKYAWIAALSGAMGVLSGYAIFLYYNELYQESASALLRIVTALVIAALVSYLIEWLRELIKTGEIEEEGHPFVRAMGTFVVVLFFELFITGFHAAAEATNTTALHEVAERIMGVDADEPGAALTMYLTAGIWVVVGALLAAWLSKSVEKSEGTLGRRIYKSARWGAIGGIAVAPVVLLVYILASRTVVAFQNTAYDYSRWTAVIERLSKYSWIAGALKVQILRTIVFATMLPTIALGQAAHVSAWLFLGCFLILLAAPYLVMRTKWGARWFRGWEYGGYGSLALFGLLFGCIAGTLIPLAASMYLTLKPLWFLKSACMPHVSMSPFAVSFPEGAACPAIGLGQAMLLATVVWGGPGIVFGLLVPLLRKQAEHPKNWAFIGYGAAALMVATSLIANQWWPLLVAFAAALAGVSFQRGLSAKDYWPFAAFCVAVSICGATAIAQKFTFAGVAKGMHTLDAVMPERVEPGEGGVSHTEKVRMEEMSRKENAERWEEEQKELVGERFEAKKLFCEIQDKRVELLLQQAMDELSESLIARQPGSPAVDRNSREQERQEQIAQIKQETPAYCPQILAKDGGGSSLVAAGMEKAKTNPYLTQEELAAAREKERAEAEWYVGPKVRRPMDSEHAVKALEIAITGSVGFWITVGLLGCWSLFEREENAEAEE